jgi:hypothetical protein
MRGRTFLRIATGVLLFFLSPGLTAAVTWYVDGSKAQSGDGNSWETALSKIQEGIDASSDGDTVIVAPGTYTENIKLNGKNIVLTSTDPLDPTVVSNTTIDGSRAGSVVAFSGAEHETCVLAGFTICNGNAYSGGGIYGGRWDTHTHAAVRHNVISDNSAQYGSALVNCDGMIGDNTIHANSSSQTSATVSSCEGTLQDNRISGNTGIGLSDCGGTIQRNIISDNSDSGVHFCNGTVKNNLIIGNMAYSGAGLSFCSGTIENNTIFGNCARYDGAALRYCTGLIRNCIIWGNWGGTELSNSSTPSFSCIENWNGGGDGNIAFNPYFVDAEKADFHLESWSPCIDAGDPASVFSDEPQPDGGRVNMGAYGNTAEATCKSPDSDSDGLPDDWELLWHGDLEGDGESDPDGDRIPDVVEYRFGWSPTVATRAPVENLTKGVAYQTIRAALVEAIDGDEIVVGPGVYRENIVFGGKNVALRSTAPLDRNVVANTIIDGMENNPVVTFSGDEDERCVLSGFTLRNGRGKISGGTWGHHSRATIMNNVITDNSGGGLLCCDGTIKNNVISANLAHGSEYWDSEGGGLYECDGTIEGNVITGNSASWGGGLAYCDVVIRNNLIAANSAGSGGGLYRCRGTIENNTIVGNSGSWQGGGLYSCDGMIRNCVIWGNTAVHGTQLYDCSSPTYCCIENWAAGGEGNIPFDPHFVDPANGDFHLTSWSPCIDAGDPTSPFDDEPQPNGERVNMGAYGNTAQAASKSPDTDADGLPDGWELHWFLDLRHDGAADPDGDRIPNLREYLYDWDPNVPVETHVRNLSRDAWYPTIQSALSDSREGDEIVVQPGIYFESIVFSGTNVVLRSTGPCDASVVASTIIDGSQSGPVVRFWGTENETCVLSGFTIQNGSSGGISGDATRATISNNRIINNFGSGLCACAGTINNNLIAGNSTELSGLTRGGGLYWCHGTIHSNIISSNAADWGGGLAFCHGVIRNNIIARNTAYLGGGLHECGALIENNTIVENSAVEHGGVGYCFGCLEHYDGTVKNCIVWGNVARFDYQVSEGTEITYSCIQEWTGGGEGNIALNPHFVDADNNNFHLQPWSPCIDAADPAYPFSEEPEPNGGRVDMGAYGNTPEATSKSADTDADTLPDDWELHWFGNLANRPSDDPDGDLIPNDREYRLAWDPTVTAQPIVWNVTSGAGYQTIQSALWESVNGDTILVPPGVYRENLRFLGKNIVLRSTSPTDATVVARTVLDGMGKGPVVSFYGTEGSTCVLSGFTITNGKGGVWGGGGVILRWPPSLPTTATIEYNAITANSDSGLAYCDGIIRKNIVTLNSSFCGGGLLYCDGVIENNIISFNFAEQDGGGLYECSGTMRNNSVIGNRANEGGGGLKWCHATVENCIIWANLAQEGSQLLYSGQPSCCCIQDWTGGGEGNISEEPRFVDAANENLRLMPDSPCIDAGFNDPELPETDIAGMHSIMFGGKSLSVDMGAYEFYINDLKPGPNPDQTTFTWSSLADKTYSIFYTDDPITWHLAIASFPSSGNTITSWADDGSLTGLPPSLVPRRFYRILENP